MSDLAPFSHVPDCRKCGGMMFTWRYVRTDNHMEHIDQCPVVIGDRGEHLDLTCLGCGWRFGMQPKFADVDR